MKGFIEITDTNGIEILINVSHIERVCAGEAGNFGVLTYINFAGEDNNHSTKQPYNEIKKLIEEASNE